MKGILWFIIVINVACAVNGLTQAKQLMKMDSKISFNSQVLNEIKNCQESMRDKIVELEERVSKLENAGEETSPCDPDPCMFGGECAVTSEGDDYECTGCPPLTAGKNCQDLEDPKTSFRLDNTVFVMYPDESVTWEEAKTKCECEDMEMAMLKDRPTHQFVLNALLAKYKNKRNQRDAFWLGLRKKTSRSPWKWVDGSGLGGYDGWAFKPVDNEQCVSIGNTDGDEFEWDADDCDGHDEWDYYALCQKDL